MSGKIYNKNLTFLQDQPFAENLLTGFYYKKRRAKSFPRTDFSLPRSLLRKVEHEHAKQSLNSNIRSSVGTYSSPSSSFPSLQDNKRSSERVLFGSTRFRNKSEKMKKAETSLVKHFCLILERLPGKEECFTYSAKQSTQSKQPLRRSDKKQSMQWESSGVFEQKVAGNIIPHVLFSVDSIQNTLLATRSSRSTERVKPPSQFKKILRESRKIRLLYGNLSRRHLSRVAGKMRLPGENLLIWLESRLDVVLKRCGFFGSIKAARQSVLSGKIVVNSKVVKSPGFILEGGDLIKVVQEGSLLDPLVKQLSRGSILSNEIFPYLLRKKKLSTALSNILRKSKSTDFFNHSVPFSKDFKNNAKLGFLNQSSDGFLNPSKNLKNTLKEDKNFGLRTNPKDGSAGIVNHYKDGIEDYTAAEFAKNSLARTFEDDFLRTPVRGVSSYRSFYTWLLRKKENNLHPSQGIGHKSKGLLSTDLHLKRSSAKNIVDLNKKILMSKNWRFIGSPHLLFSFLSLHGQLQRVISFLADTCNKDVSSDKRFVKLFSYKTQKWNHISTRTPKKTVLLLAPQAEQEAEHYSDPFWFVFYRTQFNFPTVCLTSKYCGVNTFTFNNVSRLCLADKRGESSSIVSLEPSIDTLNIEHFLNLTRQFLQKKNSGFLFNTKKSRTFNNIHNFFGEKFVCVPVELYNNLFPWFIYSNQVKYLSRENEFYRGAVSALQSPQLVSDLVKKDENNLLSVLLPDLLLYSLLIKKELIFVHSEKGHLGSNNKIASQASTASVTSSKKQKSFDNNVNPQIGLHQRFKNNPKNNPQVTPNPGPVLTSSRTFVDNFGRSKVGSKKSNLDQRFDLKNNPKIVSVGTIKDDLSVVKCIKPLHLEVSYQSLCAVYLFPPQRVCLPVMIDLDCLAKAF